jgi:hypothetical protein
MNNDDIIRLAIEHTINGLKFNEDGLLRFAKLVAQHEREKFCAALRQLHDSYSLASDSNAIRARGQA